MKVLKYLSVGYVLKPQGTKGELKVQPLTDDMERFEDLDVLYLQEETKYSPLRIIGRRYRANHVFLKLRGYDDREKAERLRGKYLWIPREMARTLPENTFFIADLIGCAVETEKGEILGKIERVLETGSNDVYLIKGSKGEILIPALKKVVVQVDIAGRKITVKAEELEGLLPNED